MGLEEKRKLKEIQDGPAKDIQTKLKALLGTDVPVEIDVASFTDITSLNTLEHSGLASLVQAIDEVTKDAIGKDALKDVLKKIVFRNLPNNSQYKVTFENGVFMNESSFGAGRYAGFGDMSRALSDKL